MKQTRNSSVELLRILSMLFIVCGHFCSHGGFNTEGMAFSLNKLILQFGVLGNLGVVIFVMISGYFLSQTDFKLSRIVRVILQVFFFSVSIYIVLVALGLVPFSLQGTIKALFPILFNQYWFATTYVVFCLLSPFLNRLLNGFTQKQYLIFLGIMLLVWSVLPTFGAGHMGSNEMCQFLLFYSIGAFVRKYPELPFSIKNRYWIVIISAALLLLSTVTLNLLAIKIPALNRGTYFYSRHSVLIIALAYGLLLIFTNLKNISNRFINIASSTTFGIYLLHDNLNMRQVLWGNILHVSDYKNSPYLILYLLMCVAVVFVICGMIDYIRQILMEKTIFRFLNPLLQRIDHQILSADREKNQKNENQVINETDHT